MRERAEGEGIEAERLGLFVGRPQAERILPDEAERIAQQLLQRGRGVVPRQHALHGRVPCTDQTVMRRDAWGEPVAPYSVGCLRPRLPGELGRARHQPVSLAHGMRRHGGAAQETRAGIGQ